MIHDQLKKLTSQLRLYGISEGFERRSEQAASQALSSAEFLRLILEDEVQFRKQASAKKITTRAKFRFIADVEDWDQSFERGLTKQKLRELASLAFIQNNENLIFVGGTGKPIRPLL